MKVTIPFDGQPKEPNDFSAGLPGSLAMSGVASVTLLDGPGLCRISLFRFIRTTNTDGSIAGSVWSRGEETFSLRPGDSSASFGMCGDAAIFAPGAVFYGNAGQMRLAPKVVSWTTILLAAPEQIPPDPQPIGTASVLLCLLAIESGSAGSYLFEVS